MPNRININSIARLITEDPDIFCEIDDSSIGGNLIDTNKPLTSLDITKQTDKIAKQPEARTAVTDQLKQQQELEKQQEEQRKKTIEPQMQQLQQAMDNLNVGVMQGKAAATTGGQQLGDLEKEMVNVNSLIGGLKKQL